MGVGGMAATEDTEADTAADTGKYFCYFNSKLCKYKIFFYFLDIIIIIIMVIIMGVDTVDTVNTYY